METDIGSDIESDPTTNNIEPQPNSDPASSSKQSHTLTISTSAFASQSQGQLPNHLLDQNQGILGEEIYINEDVYEPSEQEEDREVEGKGEPGATGNPLAHPPLVRKESSLRRRAAYLAAREDSYEAWASVSLVSAGNNHTEEEIEL
jgi:hypothetical protein